MITISDSVIALYFTYVHVCLKNTSSSRVMEDEVGDCTYKFLLLFKCTLPVQARTIKYNKIVVSCLGLVVMVLLVLSFAYLHLSIKVDILGKGNTGQQKRESGIHRNNCKY